MSKYVLRRLKSQLLAERAAFGAATDQPLSRHCRRSRNPGDRRV